MPVTLPANAPRLGWREILGVVDPGSKAWTRLRSLQYADLGRSRLIRINSFVAAALIAAFALIEPVGIVAVGAWLAVLTGAVLLAITSTRSLRDTERRSLSWIEFRNHQIAFFAVTLVWTMPAAAVPVLAAQGQAEAGIVGVVLVTMVTGWALLTPAMPLSTIFFALLTGLAGVIASLLTGQYVLAGVIAIFSATAVAGTIEASRNYLSARVAEAGMSEKNEVVSLLLREFEENQADWLWQIDTNRRVRSVSPRFSFALGQTPEAVEGTPFLQLIAGESWENGQFAPSLHDLAEHLKRRENFSNQVVRVTINGENRWWELSGTPMLDEAGNYLGFRGVGSDVTEQRESNEKIAYLARYDTLTGLPNRLMLHEALRDSLKFAGQWRTHCAFLMLDLDRFKAVNDSLGHLVGDKLLAQVSSRLKELTDENAMCGRLGGDEFAVVIREAGELKQVDRLARRIIARLSQPYDIDNHTLYVGASVGSAIGPRDGQTVEELMRNADLALYRAKDEGGGAHCEYEPALHQLAEERRKLEFSLRRAIERKELVLDFQPVVNARDERIVSFEALVRWNSSDHGVVSPGKFIPLAEDTRLIVPIGKWVLQRACCEAVAWPQDVRVAVNVSGEQLIDPEFPSTVVAALSESGLDANRLEIEVTESIFLRDPDLARAALEQVMALGCTVALDDFGTGYSSLGYLRNLRFSTIKVDRSFVQGASQDNAESLAIIRAVIAMADSLGIATTAEGVEDPEQAELVRALGCTKIQGFYFGRPMPSDEVLKLFERRMRA